MTNAYLEYLTSNENIAYPFRENSLSLDFNVTEGNFSPSKLPANYLVDASILLYSQTGVVLKKVSRGPSQSLFFSFLIGTTPVNTQVIGYSLSTGVHSRFVIKLGSYGHMFISSGEAFHSYNSYLSTLMFPSTDDLDLEFESSLVDIRLNRVESLQIHDPDFLDPAKPTGYMDGYEKIPLEESSYDAMLGYPEFIKEYYTAPLRDLPVMLVVGYNIQFVQDNNEITINCSPGLGEGQYPCEAQLDDALSPEIILPPEDRVIYTINKLTAKNGNFIIRWDDCYRIVPNVEFNTLNIYGDCKPCCDCEDYIAVGEVLQNLADKYIIPITTRVKAFTFNNPERRIAGVMDPEIYDSKLWDSYKLDYGTPTEAGTTLVDTSKLWKENMFVGKKIIHTPIISTPSITTIISNSSTSIDTEDFITWSVSDAYKIFEAIGCGVSEAESIDILYDPTQLWKVNSLKGKMLVKFYPEYRESYIISNIQNQITTADHMDWNPGHLYEIRDRTWGYSPLVRLWNIEILPNLRSVNFDIKLISGMASTSVAEKSLQSSTTARLYLTIKNFVIAKPESDANLYPIWVWVDFKDIFGIRNNLFYRNESEEKITVKDEYIEETTNFLQDGTDDRFGFNTLERNAGATRTSLLHRIYPSAQFLDRIKGHFSDELGFAPSTPEYNLILRVCNYIDNNGEQLRVTPDRLLISRLLLELKGIRITIPTGNTLQPDWDGVGYPESYFFIGGYRFCTYAVNFPYRHWHVSKYDPEIDEYVEHVYYTSIDSVKFTTLDLDINKAARYLSQAIDSIGYPVDYFYDNTLFVRNMRSLRVSTKIGNPAPYLNVDRPYNTFYARASELFTDLDGELNREWETKLGVMAINTKAALSGQLNDKPLIGLNCESSVAPNGWAQTPDDIFSETYKGTAVFYAWNGLPIFEKQDRGGNYLYLYVTQHPDNVGNDKYRWVIADTNNGILYYHDLGVDTIDDVKYAPWDSYWSVDGSEDNEEKIFTTIIGRWRKEAEHTVVPQMIILPLNREFSRPIWQPDEKTYEPSLDYISFITELNSEVSNIII